jgi:adenylate cyclase
LSFAELHDWLIEAGLAGASESALLDGFCRRGNVAGLPLAHGVMIVDTLHPAYEGRAFFWRWEDGEGRVEQVEYGPSDAGEMAETWRRSVFFHLLQTGGSQYRVRFHAGETTEFPRLAQLRDEGLTDVVALVTRFSGSGAIGEMDSLYCYWATDRPLGFTDGDVAALARAMPPLALAVKCVSLAGVADTLVRTYLGRDAGQRVLRGLIRRGIAEQIGAVLWYSDLRDFTRITDRAAPEQVIPFLNDYAEAVIASVYEHGGDVLKLIGDGILAIFASDPAEASCRGAIAAYDLMQDRVAKLNRHRAAKAEPTTQVRVGLHIGDVFFGNIGSRERLDFTVVGPAVNEVARIAALCRAVDRDILLSQAFAEAMAKLERGRLVSVGRYALRGVERPQELFTLDPFWTL